VESVAADVCACGGGITFDNLHMTDGAEIFHIILILLFNNNIFLWYFFLDKPQEIEDSIRVNSAIRNDVAKVFIAVFRLQQQRVVLRDVKFMSSRKVCGCSGTDFTGSMSIGFGCRL
jgi:hypothetical protein